MIYLAANSGWVELWQRAYGAYCQQVVKASKGKQIPDPNIAARHATCYVGKAWREHVAKGGKA